MLALTIRQNEWNNSQGTDQEPQLSEVLLKGGKTEMLLRGGST